VVDPVGNRLSRLVACRNQSAVRALCVHHQRFWTLIAPEGVDPTNNAAERALRTAVHWRKSHVWHCSAEGEIVVARLLTIGRLLRCNSSMCWCTPRPPFANTVAVKPSRHCCETANHRRQDIEVESPTQ
jgi:hypothetical protein